MDTIYSRKRIKIPKIKGFYTNNKNAKKIFSILVILLITSLTFYNLFKSLNPIFESLCLEKARLIGTNIINEASNVALEDIDYKDILKIEKDENNNVLKTDVVVINKIASDVALEAEKRFQNLKDETIQIPMGVLLGNKYLAGIGPNIDIKIIPAGNILTEIKNEFETKGINQTVYRIYLELTCKVSIVSQYKTIEEDITSQILLVETLIVGDVPESYYNLEGINGDNALDIVE